MRSGVKIIEDFTASREDLLDQKLEEMTRTIAGLENETRAAERRRSKNLSSPYVGSTEVRDIARTSSMTA